MVNLYDDGGFMIVAPELLYLETNNFPFLSMVSYF